MMPKVLPLQLACVVEVQKKKCYPKWNSIGNTNVITTPIPFTLLVGSSPTQWGIPEGSVTRDVNNEVQGDVNGSSRKTFFFFVVHEINRRWYDEIGHSKD